MKRFVYIGLALLALAACKKNEQEQGNEEQPVPVENTVKMWARSSDGNVWNSSDAIGVYTSDDLNAKYTVNYMEEGKENRAYFEGPMTPEAVVYGAYYPYDKDAGNQFDALRLIIPDDVNYGE